AILEGGNELALAVAIAEAIRAARLDSGVTSADALGAGRPVVARHRRSGRAHAARALFVDLTVAILVDECGVAVLGLRRDLTDAPPHGHAVVALLCAGLARRVCDGAIGARITRCRPAEDGLVMHDAVRARVLCAGITVVCVVRKLDASRALTIAH